MNALLHTSPGYRDLNEVGAAMAAFGIVKDERHGHFTEYDGKLCTGPHMIMDIRNPVFNFQDYDALHDLLIQSAEAAKATIEWSDIMTDPKGVISAVAVLSESHLSLHIDPANRIAHVDMYTCGKSDPAQARDIIISAFSAQDPKPDIELRGIVNTPKNQRGSDINNHYLIDLQNAFNLKSGEQDAFTNASLQIAHALNARILGGHVQEFGANYGYSGLYVLEDGGQITIHTWPEADVATLDIKKTHGFTMNQVVPYLNKAFQNPDYFVKPIKRAQSYDPVAA